MKPLLNMQHQFLSFGPKVLFDDAGFTLNKGEKVGLIGLNGAGKSTLFKLINKTLLSDRPEGKPAPLFDQNAEATFFHLPQEVPVKEFPELTVENFYLAYFPKIYQNQQEIEKLSLSLEENPSREVIQKLEKLQAISDHLQAHQIENDYRNYLELFKLSPSTATKPRDLSGGEQKKLSLASLLSARESVLLIDEPTNHLDLASIQTLENTLEGSNKTLMIISHDRYLLNNVCDKIYLVQRGKIQSFEGNYSDYLQLKAAHEQRLAKEIDRLENQHRRELAWMRQGVKARRTRSKKRVEGYHELTSNISQLKDQIKPTLNFNLHEGSKKSKKLIEFEEVSFGYQETLLENLSFTLRAKEKLAIIGNNGEGKSTLVKLIKGLIDPQQGTIKYAPDIKITLFDQKRESLDDNKTPFEIVGDGQDFVPRPDGGQVHVLSYLKDFYFTEHAIHRPVSSLSGGEKNRLQLAMYLKENADIWIFDEPTNDLDIETIELLEQKLIDFKGAVIVIGHDRAFMDSFANRTFLIQDKGIHAFFGGFEQVAPFLEIQELEKKLKLATPEKSLETPSPEKPKLKATNKQKQRAKVIEQEIEETENEIDVINSKLTTEGDWQELENLNKELKSQESKLEELMLEWEELSELNLL